MFQIEVRKADAILRKSEVITSGSVKAYGACFEFVHPIWQSLTKQAVFRCGDIQIGVMLDESSECVIPWEVLQSPGEVLEIGVYGVQGKDIVLPTIWVRAGTIRQGVDDCPGGRAPSPDAYQQLLNAIGDLKQLQTGNKQSLVDALNEVLAATSRLTARSGICWRMCSARKRNLCRMIRLPPMKKWRTCWKAFLGAAKTASQKIKLLQTPR